MLGTRKGQTAITRIESVEARTVVLPLERPLAISGRGIQERHYTLVRVRSVDGVVGLGFCYSGNHGGSLGASAVRQLHAQHCVGADAQDHESLWQSMYQASLLHGQVGIVMRALSAVDIALWDLVARSRRLPLWKLLGAYRAAMVPAYASGGYYSPGKSPEDLACEAKRYVDAGFTAVKIKVGAVPLEEDAERVAAVRRTIGPSMRLMLDANNAWTSVADALEALARFEAHDPYWIEEPFAPDDVTSHATLARMSAVPVATGEIEAGRRRFATLLANGGATIVQADAAVCGGVTEFLRIASICAGHGVRVWPHWFHDLHTHLVAAIPNGGAVEYFPDATVLNFRRLLTKQVHVSDGNIILPTDPGLGFDFDATVVESHAIDEWA